MYFATKIKKNSAKSKDFTEFWSEWGDSNSRHPAPKAGALPTALHPVIKFSNCGQTCGQGHFLTSYKRGEKCCQPRCPKALRDFHGWRLEPEPHAPKAGALPTALHPDMKLWDCPGVSSQITCATNCATPGYSIFLHDTMQRRKKQVFRVCGRRCGQARFCGSFSTGEFPPQATAPKTSGISLSGEWMGHLSSQSRRTTNCAIPGYRVVDWPEHIPLFSMVTSVNSIR